MKGNVQAIFDYLTKITGKDVEFANWEGSRRLPFVAKANLELLKCRLFGTDLLFACVSHMGSIREIGNPVERVELLRRYYDGPIVLAAGTISPSIRKSLIADGLNFVVPFKQLFLPQLLVDLNEHYPSTDRQTTSERLSPTAQAILFYLLQDQSGSISPYDGVIASDMARRIDFSPMSAGRALDELASVGAVHTEKVGRKKCLRFTEPSKTVFETFKNRLRDPVKSQIPIKEDRTFDGLVSGETALAAYSNLTAPLVPTTAIYERDWRYIQRHVNVTEDYEARFRIEIWSYNPRPLTQHNMVDRLSLYARYREHPDERVRMSAEEVLDGVRWC